MKAYSPIAIANWFIHRAEIESCPLDPMKLVKLVYLAHGWHLAVRGEALINETVEAWPYGPVVPSVYHAFKRYGKAPVDGPAMEVNPEAGDFSMPDVPRGDIETVEVLERVWEVYRGFSGIELSTLTHQPGSPWEQAWGEAEKQGKVRGIDIPDVVIREHFVALAQEHAESAVEPG